MTGPLPKSSELLHGEILPAQAPSFARRYARRVLHRFANAYEQSSLDIPLSDGGTTPWVDMLVDDRASSWLEEMGATVW